MKSVRYPRLVVVFLALICVAQLSAQSIPKWTVAVPVSTFPSTSSSLAAVTSDSAGNAFVTITHSSITNVGGIPMFSVLGSQILLVNPAGKVIASGDFPGAIGIAPLLVTARRVVALNGLTPVEFTIDANSSLVSTSLTLATGSELIVPPAIVQGNTKYLHTTVSDAGKVTEIRRYLLTKLKP